MHMTCKCGHHFCWLCGGDWSNHGAGTGGFYECNLYNPKVHDKEMDSAKKEMKRFEYYESRFKEHY